MGMSIDDAIKHAEEVAEEKFNNAVSIMDKMKSDIALSNAEECKLCAEEHRQLAEWLGKLQKITEIVAEWKVNSWTDGISYDCMVKISEVLEHGDDNIASETRNP